MSVQSWDRGGEAHDALRSAVENYGPRVLSNAPMLSNLFKDLLPDSPREASLLVQAAEADIATTLAEQIGQHIDPDTAIRLTAAALGERRAIDPTACLWATTEFALIMGYQV
ncbi:MAG: hypothetical protein M3N98_00350, partial [Actinomycetota bacterium]|nr:hypothetical protein [Actinomycetota bacterium]